MKRFFCAECGNQFNSSFVEFESLHGVITCLSDIDACPICGSRELYPDDAEGHAKEIAVALDYLDEQFSAEIEDFE